jgi:Gpi18-like mannosyltransferase
MPYFLPKMHDRYFFMADVLSIVFAFYFPRYFWIPIVVQLSSLFSYTFMLRGEPMVSLKVLAIALGIVVWFLIRLHNRTFHLKQAEPVATNLI